MELIIKTAYDSDPLLFLASALSLFLVFSGLFTRKGGIDARFIIDIFAYIATIASSLKAVHWILFRFVSDEKLKQLKLEVPKGPEGTDLLLIFGSVVAIVFVSIQGIRSSFAGEKGSFSAFDNLKARLLGLWDRFTSWLSEKFGKGKGKNSGQNEGGAEGKGELVQPPEPTEPAEPDQTPAKSDKN